MSQVASTGSAGLTVVLYVARKGLDTLMIERAVLGGQAAATKRRDNVPGFAEGALGSEFAFQLHQQVERLGVEKVTLLMRGTGTSVASEATATVYEVIVDKSG